MRGYDNPLTITYGISALAFGATARTTSIKPPRGYNQGNILDIHTMVTTTFTATTTPAYIRIGYAGNNAYYAELNMGTTAAGAGYGARDASANPIFKKIDLVSDTVTGVLTAVGLYFIAATGGSPAGTADVAITVGWF